MTDSERFSTRIKVRHYELDTLGHLNHSVYHLYGEVARLEWFEHVGGGGNGLRQAKLAPVLLESTIRFRRELRAGDEVDVSCDVSFGDGKTFRMDSEIHKLDGTLSAEITCTLGVMDLSRRKLVPDPRGELERAGLAVP
ncbi:acyl-CoA thioesterase [Haloechinothrix sp. LS1_15]|uniref:acyl-CoA thioesterase n=1 Tax=Haloechinothrix sp. LS1_15 TaxID=2652248 RepID=UPI0029473508|nr:acyl-CoA thioesterase [Haloechinothrix sp. LS1_15]MDV6014590.1 acyl-CoA thioesterase [Haloechinothrix sp. LS1_15]